MVKLLEDALEQAHVEEFERAFDTLEDIEYNLLEYKDLSKYEQETLDLVRAAIFAYHAEQMQRMLAYTIMAFDVMALPEIDNYVYDDTEIMKCLKKIEEVGDTFVDDKIKKIEWGMEMRKLNGKLKQAITAEHRRRFPDTELKS